MSKLSLLILILFTISCSTPNKKGEYRFEFINTKTETIASNTNKMDLYAPIGDMNFEMLKGICKEQKENWTDGVFYYLVVFDKKENAVFPNNPFTALYGMDEEPQKHIKAIFEFNRINGYSKLTSYSKNMLESSPRTTEIR